ncbi:SDR family oxidoreductase [Flavobacterium sp. LPB0248]|uniref:SDR family oxidoreductase n=1 Tax=Flavobacterium sp. LPB0248 TaxID=2614441 RepID=UPI001C45E099|nr:SDR family oxidoreductase [Flavobacterium sp. LPB0248]
MKKVIVITGIGGMGLAIARRIGTGHKLVLADFNGEKLEAAAESLNDAGYEVQTAELDITNKKSVEQLAQTAAELGAIHSVIHTAGISPTMSDPAHILNVNLIGTARIIETFYKHISAGSVGIIIASMAGHMSTQYDSALDRQQWSAQADHLKLFIDSLEINERADAYSVSKKGNILQVQASAASWGEKGARILSISPGIISTPMGQQEKKEQPVLNYMLQNGPVKRMGTPEDIAGTVEFLLSPQAGFITGTDLLIDGGAASFLKKIFI